MSEYYIDPVTREPITTVEQLRERLKLNDIRSPSNACCFRDQCCQMATAAEDTIRLRDQLFDARQQGRHDSMRIESLKEDVEELEARIEPVRFLVENPDIAAEIFKWRRDALRYRWLRIHDADGTIHDEANAVELDSHIDAAMKARQP